MDRQSTDILTTLRFVAAAIVLVFHFGRETQLAALAPHLAGAGSEMVTFFFVLSGFVMMAAYWHRPRLGTATYLIGRIARIAPLYLVALAAAAWFDFHPESEPPYNLHGLLLSATALQAWVPPFPMGINEPGWSISVEAFFYLLFPLPLLLLKRWQPKPLWVLAGAFGLWVLTQIVLTVILNTNGLYRPYPSISHDLTHFFPPVHLCSFFLGIAGGYQMFHARRPGEPLEDGIWTFMAVISFLLTLYALSHPTFLKHMWGVDLPHRSSFLAPLFLWTLVMQVRAANPVKRFFSSKPFLLLGTWSYGFYILQKPVHLAFMFWLDPHLPENMSKDLHFALLATLVLLASALGYYLIEHPAQKTIMALWRKCTTPKSQAPSK